MSFGGTSVKFHTSSQFFVKNICAFLHLLFLLRPLTGKLMEVKECRTSQFLGNNPIKIRWFALKPSIKPSINVTYDSQGNSLLVEVEIHKIHLICLRDY